MELHQIETNLNSSDPQNRIKAITELRHYEPDLVVPLLKGRMYNQEFVIRSVVAMGLGYKRTEEAFGNSHPLRLFCRRIFSYL